MKPTDELTEAELDEFERCRPNMDRWQRKICNAARKGIQSGHVNDDGLCRKCGQIVHEYNYKEPCPVAPPAGDFFERNPAPHAAAPASTGKHGKFTISAAPSPAIGDVERLIEELDGRLARSNNLYPEFHDAVLRSFVIMRSLAAENTEFRKALAVAEKQLRELDAEKAKVGAKLASAEESVWIMGERCAALRTQLTQTRADDDAAYQRVAKELEVANDEIEKLRAKLDATNTAWKEQLSELSSLRAEKAKLDKK